MITPEEQPVQEQKRQNGWHAEHIYLIIKYGGFFASGGGRWWTRIKLLTLQIRPDSPAAKVFKLADITYLWRSAETMDKPDPLSVLGKKYNRETARQIPYGGLVSSKGIIVKVVTEEQANAQSKACKEHLMKLLTSAD